MNGVSKKSPKSSEDIIMVDESDSEIPSLSLELEGQITCDIPKDILCAKSYGSEIQCLINWHKRYDGTKPVNSFISNKVLKKKYPLLLIEYYESKIIKK